MNKIYILLISSMMVLNFYGFGQTTRSASVLLHETFESNSTTLGSWTSTTSPTCVSDKWYTQNKSGNGAILSSGYEQYPSASAASGCYANLVTPVFTITPIDKNDSISVSFYMGRFVTSSTDYLSVSIMDENNSPVFGPYTVFVSNTKNPTSSAGWNQLTWNIGYNNSIASNLSTKGFKVGFTAVSAHGVDILMDEVKISHTYTHNAAIAPVVNNHNYFTCYPNPAHNSINLHFNESLAENSILNIYNINGKLVMARSVPAGTSETTLDINTLWSGLYILELKNNAIVSRKEILL